MIQAGQAWFRQDRLDSGRTGLIQAEQLDSGRTDLIQAGQPCSGRTGLIQAGQARFRQDRLDSGRAGLIQARRFRFMTERALSISSRPRKGPNKQLALMLKPTAI